MKLKSLFYTVILFTFFIVESFAEITYLQILKDPTDLRLNLQYAKEQEAKGEYKAVIATLERLNALYPNNIDLKLYLLSISIKTDSTEKTLNLISKIQSSDQISDEIKKKVAQIFDDMNKKKIDKEIIEKKKEREKSQLASQKKQPEKASSWTWYTELSFTNLLNSNISNVSATKTQFSGGSVIAMTGIEGDDVATLKNGWGAIYQINSSSNLSLYASHSSSEQNRATSDENDTQLFSATYSKFLEKNTITSTFSFTDLNTRRAADTLTRNITLDNRYFVNDKIKFLNGINLGTSEGNQNPSNQTKRHSNTRKKGLVIGPEYYFTPQHSLKLKYAFTGTDAIADYNSLEDETVSLSYAKNFDIGNLGLTFSISDKKYKEPDAVLIHPSISRKDDSETKTISFSGNLNQLLSAQKFFPISVRLGNFLNTISYSSSWSETDSDSTLLQHNYKKESFTIGLTKRIYFQ